MFRFWIFLICLNQLILLSPAVDTSYRLWCYTGLKYYIGQEQRQDAEECHAFFGMKNYCYKFVASTPIQEIIKLGCSSVICSGLRNTCTKMEFGGTNGTISYLTIIQGKTQLIELFRITPIPVFILGFVPPLCAAVLSISIALIFHNDQISNYNWQCGRAKFPSLSRIINLPLERIIWQILIFAHVPIRLLELVSTFVRYERLFEPTRNKKVFDFMRWAYLLVGLGELFFLGALSIIGERENTQIHVIMFYIFGFCGIGFFIASTYCHRQTLYYTKPYGKLSYRLKIIFMTCYLICLPVLVTSFLLYWRLCLTFSYDIFAVCEYLGVLFNIGFHGSTFFDVKDKLMLSIRLVEPLEQTIITTNDDSQKNTVL
uniref:Uncharacterized protein n=1 Tax=Panagrolaimus sp. JU765 TaxID=591449 RepID=A0AC34QKC7_9BILA